MVDQLEPTKPISGSGYTKAHALPKHLPDAIDRFHGARRLHELFGPMFCQAFMAVKGAEWDAYQDVVSSWEREYLLLNV
jgi:glutamine synthetase